MKKTLLLSSILWLSLGVLMAAPISPQRALQIAKLQMQQAPTALRVSAPLRMTYTASLSSHLLRSQSPDQPAYYVFNYDGAPGFVVVAGDDRAPLILAYSYTHTFDHHNMPENLSHWMDGYTQQIAAVVDGRATFEIKEAPLRASTDRVPLLEAKDIQWDQIYPWNSESPMVDGIRGYTGCVATAVSQIMAYHEWPKQSMGQYKSVIFTMPPDPFSVTPSDTYTFGDSYDWPTIIQAGKAGSQATATQAKAIGKFTIDVGRAVNMKYLSYGSGTLDQFVLRALRENFGYKEDCRLLRRKNYNDADWDNILRAEIDAERPVFYAGSGSRGGHAFICDGYDADGKFHFNWGWRGMANGYYASLVLTPSSVGSGGGDGNFSTHQEIIIDIIPATDPQDKGSILHKHFSLLSQGNYYNLLADNDANGLNISFVPYVINDYEVEGAMRFVAYVDNKRVEGVVSTEIEIDNIKFYDNYLGNLSRKTVKVAKELIPPGKAYTFMPECKIKGSQVWTPASADYGDRIAVRVIPTGSSYYTEYITANKLNQYPTSAVSPTGLSVSELEVYPTVASDYITVSLSEPTGVLQILDLRGTVMRSLLLDPSSDCITIDVSTLSPGTYIVRTGSKIAKFAVR